MQRVCDWNPLERRGKVRQRCQVLFCRSRSAITARACLGVLLDHMSDVRDGHTADLVILSQDNFALPIRAPPLQQIHRALLHHLTSGSLDLYTLSLSNVDRNRGAYTRRWSRAVPYALRHRLGVQLPVVKATTNLCTVVGTVLCIR